MERLRFVKHLKPLQFSLEAIHELLAILDERADAIGDDRGRSRLGWFVETGEAQCEVLRRQLSTSEQVVDELRSEAKHPSVTVIDAR